MNQAYDHDYANHTSGSIFQMEIGRKPSQILNPHLLDYTGNLKPSEKGSNKCICQYFSTPKATGNQK